MTKLFKPASILFYFLITIVFFIGGIYVAKLVGAGKNQMLAGGAIVLFYGIISAFLSFLLSIFFAYRIKHNTLVWLNKLLGILFFLMICLVAVPLITGKKKVQQEQEYQQKTTTPINKNIRLISWIDSNKPEESLHQNTDESLGIGFFKPDIFKNRIIYFYSGVNLEKNLLEHIPTDSIVFANDQYNSTNTTYAPPWLYPAYLKLDYGIILFKALGIGYDFVKVEANKNSKQVTYLNKNCGKFKAWPEFILSVNSVEFNEKSAKKVFVKPLDYAGEVMTEFTFMKPLLVEEDWMYVVLLNDGFAEQGKGWIRWKKDNLLLITFSLLS